VPLPTEVRDRLLERLSEGAKNAELAAEFELGGVDGFDQDKHAGEGDEGGEVLGGLLAA